LLKRLALLSLCVGACAPQSEGRPSLVGPEVSRQKYRTLAEDSLLSIGSVHADALCRDEFHVITVQDACGLRATDPPESCPGPTKFLVRTPLLELLKGSTWRDTEGRDAVYLGKPIAGLARPGPCEGVRSSLSGVIDPLADDSLSGEEVLEVLSTTEHFALFPGPLVQ
jgi:hypothetical protein